MRQIVFCVRDVKAGAYSTPFFKPAVGLAVRDFSDAAKEAGSVISRHPEDFELYQIGIWDDETGTFTPEEGGMKAFGRASDYLPKAGSLKEVS